MFCFNPFIKHQRVWVPLVTFKKLKYLFKSQLFLGNIIIVLETFSTKTTSSKGNIPAKRSFFEKNKPCRAGDLFRYFGIFQ